MSATSISLLPAVCLHKNWLSQWTESFGMGDRYLSFCESLWSKVPLEYCNGKKFLIKVPLPGKRGGIFSLSFFSITYIPLSSKPSWFHFCGAWCFLPIVATPVQAVISPLYLHPVPSLLLRKLLCCSPLMPAVPPPLSGLQCRPPSTHPRPLSHCRISPDSLTCIPHS